jgi:uncharacterized protein (TIGR03032 family)
MTSHGTRRRVERARWHAHNQEWRAPEQVATLWREAAHTDPRLLRGRAYGSWWETIGALGVTVLVSREYEHLLVAMTMTRRGPRMSFMPMPHPSGIAVDRRGGRVLVASTRNPNLLYEFRPAAGLLARRDVPARVGAGPLRPLLPVAARIYPGCLRLHDLALVGRTLHGNAVGQNAVVRLGDGDARPVWWPASIERRGVPDLGQNYLQLNSIAAGRTLRASYFSASGARIGRRRPGDPLYPVKGRGVLFSGETRDVVSRGLTRPHSARLYQRELWVANSGYGEIRRADLPATTSTTVVTAPGWTRGLAFAGGVGLFGTSRVIPRFHAYAPGLDVDRSVCGVHAFDVGSGRVLGGYEWPSGNQIFAVDWVNAEWAGGWPFLVGDRDVVAETALFYAFTMQQPAPAEDL